MRASHVRICCGDPDEMVLVSSAMNATYQCFSKMIQSSASVCITATFEIFDRVEAFNAESVVDDESVGRQPDEGLPVKVEA